MNEELITTYKEYETIYELKEILDDVEREYLGNLIKPFRNRVKYITKKQYNGEECIVIFYINVYPTTMLIFKPNTMYKNMELNKEYTLEELGL